MDAALTPDLAVGYLRELAADLVAAVVLGSGGEALAGPRALAAAAARLLPELGEGTVAQVRMDARLVVAGRSATHVVVAIHTEHALAGLVRHDVRTVLGDLAADGRVPADSRPVPLDRASAAVRAILAGAAAAPRAPGPALAGPDARPNPGIRRSYAVPDVPKRTDKSR